MSIRSRETTTHMTRQGLTEHSSPEALDRPNHLAHPLSYVIRSLGEACGRWNQIQSKWSSGKVVTIQWVQALALFNFAIFQRALLILKVMPLEVAF